MTDEQKAKAAARERAWREANRDAYNASIRAYRARNKAKTAAQHRAQTDRHPERYMLRAARNRARLAGIAFTICEADIVIPTHCPALGIPLARSTGSGGGRASDNSPSLDRVDPTRGYEKGNIAVVSNRANRLKNDGTADEHERIAAWIKKVSSS